MAEIMKGRVGRSLLAVFLLWAPWLVGWVLNIFGIQPFGFVLFAVYPKLVLDPYGAYAIKQGALISAAQWVAVIIFAAYICRMQTLIKFIVLMLILGAGSTVVCHSLMTYFGFHMYIDAP